MEDIDKKFMEIDTKDMQKIIDSYKGKEAIIAGFVNIMQGVIDLYKNDPKSFDWSINLMSNFLEKFKQSKNKE
jgi:hypothetical protein